MSRGAFNTRYSFTRCVSPDVIEDEKVERVLKDGVTPISVSFGEV